MLQSRQRHITMKPITKKQPNRQEGKRCRTMKRTKNMIYKETAESQELYFYGINNRRIYDGFMYDVNNLNKKAKKGVYDSEKAVDLFYYLATEASNLYKKEFGYSFSVGDRFTVAVDMRDAFEADYIESAEVVEFGNVENCDIVPETATA